MPLISILIPCYNAEKWIAECIDSALGQSYPNREIIVVDDGSTDKSIEVLKTYSDRIRFETGPNRGANAARNQLLGMAGGEWIQYLDADDYLLPDKLAKQMDYVASHPEVDVVYSPCILLMQDGRQIQNPIANKSDPIISYIRWNFTTHGLLLRKSLLRKAGPWKETQKCCQENELLLRLIRHGARFGLVDEYDAVYRYHAGVSISRGSPERVIRARMALTDEIEKYLLENNELTKERRLAIASSRFESARSMYRLNRDYAAHLMTLAISNDQNPAQPRLYRWALRFLGFDGAEKLASIKYRFGRSQG